MILKWEHFPLSKYSVLIKRIAVFNLEYYDQMAKSCLKPDMVENIKKFCF